MPTAMPTSEPSDRELAKRLRPGDRHQLAQISRVLERDARMDSTLAQRRAEHPADWL